MENEKYGLKRISITIFPYKTSPSKTVMNNIGLNGVSMIVSTLTVIYTGKIGCKLLRIFFYPIMGNLMMDYF